MSGIVRGAGKVFGKVLKTVKKVAPYALAAAAIVYTGGAALGVSGMAGGWAAASASASSMFGSTLAPIVSGAVAQAGYGAMIGGGVAAITGKNIGRGISSGAAIGVATGAATGLLMPGAVPRQTLGQANAAKDAAAEAARIGPVNGAPRATQVADAGTGANTTIGPAVTSNTTPPATSGLSGVIERHPVLASSALNSLGTGLLSVAQNGDNTAEQRADEIRKNYGDQPYTGLLRPDQVQGSVRNRPKPEDRFSYSFEVAWNPQTRRLEKVSVTA